MRTHYIGCSRKANQCKFNIAPIIVLVMLFCITDCFAQPYSTQAVLTPYATYYQMNFNAFDDFTNGVWSDVYNWDPGKDYFDKNAGSVIGGWKSVSWDNLTFGHYTEYGGYWEGFCPSNREFVYKEVNPLNQFTSTTIGGKDGVGTPYFIGYYGWGTDRANSCRFEMQDGVPCGVAGMYVTNLYYSYQSIKNGDGFAKTFTQGDWFLLTAYGFDLDGNCTGNTEFYLADYRSSDTTDWYVINDWRWFDLSSLGKVRSVEFVLSSSDNSVYGMNTPSYFCMDKLTLSLISIKQQPKSQIKCIGDSATFSVEVIGEDYFNTPRKGRPLVQWRKNGIDIPGATDTILVLKNITATDTGGYSCYTISDYETHLYQTIYNDTTFKAEALSATATLSLNPQVTITQQPKSLKKGEGQDALFSARSSSGTIAYQWLKNSELLKNRTSDTLILTNVQLSDSGAYRCVAIGRCQSDTSTIANLEVKPIIPIPIIDTNVTICENSELYLSVGNTSTLHYQWNRPAWSFYWDNNYFLSIPKIQLKDSGEYRCSISNDSVIVKVLHFHVSVLKQTRLICQDEDYSISKGSIFTLAVLASGENVTYQWYIDSVAITDATNRCHDITDTNTYYCRVSGTCGDTLSAGIKISYTTPKDVDSYISPTLCKTGTYITLTGFNGYVLQLINCKGQVVSVIDVQRDKEFLCMSYPAGIYFVTGEKHEHSAESSNYYQMIIIQ